MTVFRAKLTRLTLEQRTSCHGVLRHYCPGYLNLEVPGSSHAWVFRFATALRYGAQEPCSRESGGDAQGSMWTPRSPTHHRPASERSPRCTDERYNSRLICFINARRKPGANWTMGTIKDIILSRVSVQLPRNRPSRRIVIILIPGGNP